MESSMVNSNEFIEYIKKYFSENINEFCLKSENFHGPFWNVEFTNDVILVNISGDIGFQIDIDFYGKKYPLWQYDYSISQKTQTNFQNLEYQLNALKSLLKSLDQSMNKMFKYFITFLFLATCSFAFSSTVEKTKVDKSAIGIDVIKAWEKLLSKPTWRTKVEYLTKVTSAYFQAFLFW